MLILQGRYQVSPTKRLTISAEPRHAPEGAFLLDLQALQQACGLNDGQCKIQFNTAHGVMQGTLFERPGRRYDHRLYEGHVAFVPQA
ncbi:hypothetical protein [Deinococcus sp. Leaf326]|jgi:hypothetical protein|uniref:hypothetical protein n=1 Tax=Deinococcus sp. Leaf326 TaxID=1736338 RepID=UPI0006F9D9E7|nr:hypothetical protein [Deinococcus sp. Leaf326]KQR25548.1 hypothetical protein ASF71_19060 [Deinococcus sp. Leaf326]